MFCLIAFHYPKPEHRKEMIQRLRRAAEVTMTTDGCLNADCWVEEAGDGVVATGTWKSKDQCQRSFAALTVAGVDWQFDERESRPRTVYSLMSPTPAA